MKKKDKANISGMTVNELTSALAEVDEKLVKLNLARATSQNRNTREARNLRKRKAVILTKLHEKEIHG